MSETDKQEEYCTEHRCTCGPPPKRRRNRKISILDLLEIDLCRRAILKYLPLRDLLRSERVCHRWRNAMHHYLRGARRIRSRLHVTAPWHPLPPRPPAPACRPLPLDESRDPWYQSSLYKWGKSINAAPCTAESFALIVDQCPNIEEITFYGVPDRDLIRESVEKLRKLKRVAFRNLFSDEGEREQATDEDVEIFLHHNTIVEITVIGNDQFTGACLQHLQNNLTSLRFRNCPSLDYRNLISILKYLKDATTLELSRNSADVLKNVHILLDGMPKLDHLELCGYDKMELGGHLKAHDRLARLRRLSLRRNRNVNDDWMENVARGRRLMYLDVSYCKGVTMTGLTEVCEASRAMSELGLANNDDITDEDVETIIRLCPNLTMLNIQKCPCVTSDLVVYLARIMRRRRRWRLPALRLRLYGTVVPETMPKCPGVTSDLVVYLARIMRRRSRWRLPALRLRLYGTVVPETMPMIYSFILDFTKGAHCTAKPNPYLGF